MFSEIEKSLDSVMANPYYAAAIVLFISLYVGRAVPELPKQLVDVFQHGVTRLVVLFMLAYNITRDPFAAVVGTMALFGVFCMLDGNLEAFGVEEFEVDEE